jgi:hypothetical protein
MHVINLKVFRKQLAEANYLFSCIANVREMSLLTAGECLNILE